MMNCTDRHDRYFLRLIAKDVQLYTEMITALAIIHGDPNYLLAFDPDEKYVALQLGGSDPAQLTYAAKVGEDFGYNEINLNVGCPSSRVSAGRFGACLMLEPELVADCVAAMQAKVTIPITVKCRIGVDEKDNQESLYHFIQLISQAGCKTVIVHARKAWLSGLSPKQNRDIPPLRYEVVHQLKKDFPALTIIVNGGIKNISDIDAQLLHVDGIMIGRAAYSNPYFLADIQARYFSKHNVLSRFDVIKKLIPYIQKQQGKGVRLHSVTRHILGLFQGKQGASVWRRYLSEHAHKAYADVSVIEKALKLVTENGG
jgi:tRNA-dihydrouridine synthase A